MDNARDPNLTRGTRAGSRRKAAQPATLSIPMHEVHAAPAFAGHAKTERVSVSSAGVQGDGHGFSPSISAHGRYVAFRSHATDLVVSDTNGVADTCRARQCHI